MLTLGPWSGDPIAAEVTATAGEYVPELLITRPRHG